MAERAKKVVLQLQDTTKIIKALEGLEEHYKKTPHLRFTQLCDDVRKASKIVCNDSHVANICKRMNFAWALERRQRRRAADGPQGGASHKIRFLAKIVETLVEQVEMLSRDLLTDHKPLFDEGRLSHLRALAVRPKREAEAEASENGKLF